MNAQPTRLAGLLLAASVLLAACGAKTDADMVKAAKSHLQNNDPKAALIELKSALQKNPKSGEARYLLGKMLLDGGDPVAAQVELQKAADERYNVALVVPPLARALYEQAEFKKVVDGYAKFLLPDPQAQADLRTTVATSMARLGQRDEAAKLVTQTLTDAPQHVAALVLKARLAADQRDFDAANKTLADVLARDPKSSDAWMLKGDIELYGQQDRKSALASYRKAA